MAQLKLNKASLSLEQKNLQNYKKYLPSLELKRKKLLFERRRVEDSIVQLKQQEQALAHDVEANFPMLSEDGIKLQSLITIDNIALTEENLVGVRLPVFQSLHCQLSDYAFLNSPHWLEAVFELIKKRLELQITLQIAEQRCQLLNKAIQTVTQRKNLFEKVLIPTAQKHIRLIQIVLADNERAAVVCSKTAKKKRQVS